MCTVLLAFNIVKGWPLVAANNRDEFLQRRALPPRVYRSVCDDGRRWIASCDLSGGGSWWGYNNRGLMVWLTNRWLGDAYRPASRSRGELVLELLACDTPQSARSALADTCAVASFNPFNLIVVSPDEGFFSSNYPQLQFYPLFPGYHFLGNGLLDACMSVKARSARRLFADLRRQQQPNATEDELMLQTLTSFQRGLRTPFPHDDIPPQGFNVTFDGYGTTASLCLAVAESGPENFILHYCDANPLYEGYRDYSRLGRFL
ncbi:MAG: NRDE family protein [Deltaproteobacteria bacterium]|nr:NRDE family protein [Deltaproteobacteria bacterium]